MKTNLLNYYGSDQSSGILACIQPVCSVYFVQHYMWGRAVTLGGYLSMTRRYERTYQFPCLDHYYIPSSAVIVLWY